MNILAVGRRRLHISIRLERVPEDAGSLAERAYQAREARRHFSAERNRHEIEKYTTMSGVH